MNTIIAIVISAIIFCFLLFVFFTVKQEHNEVKIRDELVKCLEWEDQDSYEYCIEKIQARELVKCLEDQTLLRPFLLVAKYGDCVERFEKLKTRAKSYRCLELEDVGTAQALEECWRDG